MDRRLRNEPDDDGTRCHIPPPIPAPYLIDAPQLPAALSYGSRQSIPDEQLDQMPALRLEMAKRVRDCRIAILRRRLDWQREHGVVIQSEKTFAE